MLFAYACGALDWLRGAVPEQRELIAATLDRLSARGDVKIGVAETLLRRVATPSGNPDPLGSLLKQHFGRGRHRAIPGWAGVGSFLAIDGNDSLSAVGARRSHADDY